MKHRMLTIFLTFAALTAAGQTDIGSSASVGTVTNESALATMSPQKKLELQKQELHSQLTKVKSHAQNAQLSVVGFTDADQQNIEKAYDEIRRSGREMSPFDFLATTLALQGLPPGNLPNKNANAVRAQLEANGIKSTNVMMFAEVVGGGGEQAAGPPSKQYKQSLSKAREELRKALQ